MRPRSLLAPVLAVITPVTSAFPNVTAIPVGGGTCSGFPASYPTSGRSADAFVFRTFSVEKAEINDLPTYMRGDTLVVALVNTTTPQIFCCDHGGTVYDGFESNALYLPANSTMMTLQYFSADYLSANGGIKPETYLHEIDGVRQNGTFLGSKNVTTWAFGRLAKETSWRARLLLEGSLELQTGEARGFLKVVAP